MPSCTLGKIALSGFIVSAALISAPLLSAGAALAQSNPSADSIIESLTPRAGSAFPTRGIRPLTPAVPQAETPAAPAVERAPFHAAMPRPAAAGMIAPRRVAPAASPATPPAGFVGGSPAAPSVNLTVQFANNSAELTPAAMRTLDELGRALSSDQLASFRFRIEGHTDTLGSPELNQSLSERRALAVVGYLETKFHVDAARLEPVGMGETRPLVPTGANVAEPRNRRVTVVNVGA